MGEWAAVALLAASPIGEELISIPAGWGMGLPLPRVALVSAVFNFAPVPVLLWLIGIAGEHPHIARFVGWFRKERVMNAARKYGFAGVALLAPVAGVYATTVCAWVVGIPRGRILLWTAAGLALYAAATCGALWFGGKAWAAFSQCVLLTHGKR